MLEKQINVESLPVIDSDDKTQVFESNEFGQLEVLMIGDNPFFPAKDCAAILGYKDTTNAIKQHCRGVVKHHLIDGLGRKQQANFIPEGDLYRLIVRSKLPDAVRFESWIFDDVLPSIRKTGSYGVPKLNKIRVE